MTNTTAGTPMIQLALFEPASVYHKTEKITKRGRLRQTRVAKVSFVEKGLSLNIGSFFFKRKFHSLPLLSWFYRKKSSRFSPPQVVREQMFFFSFIITIKCLTSYSGHNKTDGTYIKKSLSCLAINVKFIVELLFVIV